MSIGTLTVDLVMKTGKFETDTKRAERAASNLAKKIDAQASAIGTAIGVGAVAAFTALAVGIKSAVDSADEMGKMAQKIGVTTEALSGLSFAASQSEVETEQLQKALAKLSVDLTKSDSGLRELGITATTSDQALIQLADVFAKMPDGLQKTALAAKIFGERIGPDLIPLLNLGANGINQLKDRAQELGIVISDEMARDADTFNDTMDEVKGAMQGAFLTASNDLLPTMQEFASFMASSEAQEGIKNITALLTSLGKVAFETLSFVGRAIKNMQDDLTVAVNGQLFASDKKLKRQIESAKERLAQLENFAPGVDTPLKKSLRAQIGGYEQQQRNNLAQSITNSIQEPPPPSARNAGVTQDAISRYLNEPKDKKLKKNKTPTKTDEDLAAERLKQQYDDLNASLAERIELFGQESEVAKITYETQHGDLSKLTELEKQGLIQKAGEIDALIKLSELKEEGKQLEESLLTVDEKINEEKARYKELLDASAISIEVYQKALESAKTPAEEELQRLRNELELLGLTNEEREKRIFLLNNPGATPEQAAEAGQLITAANQANKAQQAMDQFRSSASSAFADFLTGSASAKDAFTAFADSVIQQIANILAEQAIAALFGGAGGAGGGSFGGGIGGFFAGLFGGGRANGGPTQSGKFYRVNENQPEILNYRGEDFLMMGGGHGMVKQNRASGGTANVTINLPPSSGRRSELQAAQRAAEESSRAMSRNR